MGQNMPPLKTGETRWYLKWWSIFIWFAIVGPFGLPLLWKSKDFSLFWKWFWTIFIIALTIALTWMTWKTIEFTINQFRSVGLI